MKGIIAENEALGVDQVIPVPNWMPFYGVGTYVYAVVKDEKGNKKEVEGDIVGFELSTFWDKEQGFINTVLVYRVADSRSDQLIDVLENEIDGQLAETNDLDAEFYVENNADDEGSANGEGTEGCPC